MSWQTYVDNNLVGSGKVSQAAIIGIEGGIWASSLDFHITTEEQNGLVAGFKDKDLFWKGLSLAGKSYTTIHIEGDRIIVKNGNSGATIYKTKQAIIIGVYNAPITASENSLVIREIGEYLTGIGY